MSLRVPVVLVSMVVLLSSASHLRAQGALTPSGAPAPTMKTLQQLWDRLDQVEAAQAGQSAFMQNISLQNSVILSALGVTLPWAIESLPSFGLPGLPSLAFTPDGGTAIAVSQSFISNTNKVYFMRKTGSTWTSEVLHSSTDYPSAPALAYTSDGAPHVAYALSTAKLVRVTRFANGSWSNHIVDAGSDFAYPSLAASPSDVIAVSYFNTTSGTLMYAWFNGVTWNRQVVEAVTLALQGYTSLKFSPAGRPSISYADGGANTLKFAQHDGTNWNIASVAGPVAGRGSSLAFDAAGRPAISYVDESGLSINIARFDGAVWNVDTAETVPVPTVNVATSLGFDPAGNPMIAYHDWQNTTLNFVSYNGTWTSSLVDDSSNAGLFLSLAIAPDGQPAIAYFTDSEVKYAKRAPFAP